MPEPVVLERYGQVGEVVLNRPARRNALSGAAIDELDRVAGALAASGVGAVILRGAGDFFCSGLDLAEFSAAAPPAGRWIAVHSALARLQAPVIACLRGGAINAGAALALAADLIVAGDTSYLQIMEAAIGMTPTVNAAWLAVRYPASVGLQLALSGRRFSGPDLYRLGVAMEVAPDSRALERARELASRLAAFPDGAAATTKRVLGAARDHGTHFDSAATAALTAGSRR